VVTAAGQATVVQTLGDLWSDLCLARFPLSPVVLLGVLFCVFVQWEGVISVRLSLIPRMALGLLHELLLPIGRPRVIICHPQLFVQGYIDESSYFRSS
jgi:hypothetical protein